jgi:hypothetical protein
MKKEAQRSDGLVEADVKAEGRQRCQLRESEVLSMSYVRLN